MSQPQAPLTSTDDGLIPAGPGWFIANASDVAWRRRRGRRSAWFENRDGASFPALGLNLVLLDPGEPNGKYHGEAGQEAFLVLQGEALLIIEEQEVPVGAWDFVHVPPWTNHIFVGAGDAACAILMAGARPDVPDEESIVYPVSEVAARHGASVETETRDVPTAYSDWPAPEPIALPWPPPPAPPVPRRPRRGSPDESGWFVQHVADAKWMRDTGGAFAALTHGKEHFPQLGINLALLDADQAVCRYHEESVQEDFLILAGEARAIVEGQEIRMRQWDLLHCPAGTRHVLAGTEAGGAVALMLGARDPDGSVLYPRNELAARYSGSADVDTPEPPVAYADWSEPQDIAAPWPPPALGS